MKIVVIHGQSHKGSTYHVTQLFLAQFPNSTITEFKINNIPFCVGCYNCILKGEDQCPHYSLVQPIINAIESSDVVVFDSPTYCLEMTGQLKTFFDHMAYRWIPHRPHPAMGSKIGIAISTTAGAGASSTTKSIKRQMFWWGIPKIYRIKTAVAAMKWDEVKPETKNKITRKVRKTAGKVHSQFGSVKPGIRTTFFFNLMKAQMKKNDWNLTDKKHWEENGWL